jgi:plastocyanin
MRSTVVLAVCTVLACVATSPARGQSLLYRPPNLSGTWVPDAGAVQFNFVHRFHVFPAPSHLVVNYPSFTFAAGLGRHLAIGWHFGTHTVVRNVASNNESELYARYRAGATEGAPGFAVAVTPAYNAAAKSVDGEVTADYTRGRITLSGAARVLAKPLGLSGGARAAFAGGFTARLTRYIGVSADVGSFVGPTTLATWGAAIDFVIPGSPHTFSLQASNAAVNTMQGNSQGTKQRRYGFEFTIPLHLKRFGVWFHKEPQYVRTNQPLVNGHVAAEVRLEGLRLHPDSISINAGETVIWTNADQVEHTVTFDGSEAGSGLLARGAVFPHRFDRPGTYTYHCTPHPYMKGVVVVR